MPVCRKPVCFNDFLLHVHLFGIDLLAFEAFLDWYYEAQRIGGFQIRCGDCVKFSSLAAILFALLSKLLHRCIL